jgi:hypothetical protein
MLVAYDAKYDGDTERALLRYWADWMKRLKRHQKHIQRIYPRSPYCQKRREALIIQAEINTLKTCINQVHALRRMRNVN